MAAIRDNLQAVKERIERAVAAAGREAGCVRLLAVSKTHPPAMLEEAWNAGQLRATTSIFSIASWT